MAIKIRKQAAASVEIPPSTHSQFFVDTDGLPKLKDDLGAVTDAAQAGQVTLNEQLSDPPAVADKVKLYSKDVLGISEFFARDDQGNVIQITSGGALNVPPAGGGGAFWDGAQKAVVEYSNPGGLGPVSVPTGIIVLPSPGVYSAYQCRFEGFVAQQGYQISAFMYLQFVLFSNGVGTPDVRFGTGNGDPGWASDSYRGTSGGPGRMYSYQYNRSQDSFSLPDYGNDSMTVAASGEISMNFNWSSNPPIYVKGVFAVSPEIIVPFSP